MNPLLIAALAISLPVGPMTAPRLRPAMVLLNDGRVLVAGGLTAGSQALSSAEIYDPKTRTFRATSAPMANRHSSPAAVLLNDGRVLISDAQTDAPSFEIYDPATDRFTAPPQPAVHHLNAPLVKLPDGRVVVLAGSDLMQIANAIVEIFDPTMNRWSSGGSLHAARFAGAAILLSSGRVLIFGGLNLTAGYPDSEVYDPATQTSVVLPGTIFTQPIALQLADGRAAVIETTMFETFDEATLMFRIPIDNLPTSGQSVTRLFNGLLLLAGGVDAVSGAPVSTLLTIDPNAGTFAPVGTLTVARSPASSVVLNDGSVLIAGGSGTASAEVVRFERRRAVKQ